ncbi:MAG TPA: ABC transporter permease [Vicinamibacterales bacterium]
MSAPREWIARVLGTLRGRPAQDLGDELRFHAEMLEEELRRQGLTQDEARREARVRLGGSTQIVEAYREQQRLPLLDALAQDVRYGLRTLRRTPGFTIASLLTIALGIGANAAIFSIVNAVLLRPLPFPGGDRLVVLGERDSSGRPGTLGYLTAEDYRARSAAFESIAIVRGWQPTLVANGEAERLMAMRVNWNFFETLGVRPALGTSFTAAEDRPDQWRVVMLSDALWRRRFGGDPAIVGRSITMNDVPYRVVGVMPPSFEPLVSTALYEPAELWAPLGYAASLPYACRTCQHLKAVGRLKPGVTVEQAQADLSAIRTQLALEHPTEYASGDAGVMALQDFLAGPVRRPLLVLLAAVGFVLLIACANVANLLLARASSRAREMAVRNALGAGRGRLVRQLLTESLMLSAAGTGAGIALAALILSGVSALAPVTIPRLAHATIDGPVLAFAVALALATGLLFGVFPAYRASAAPLRQALATDSRGSIGTAGHARRALVVADLALALVLLSGAALMLKSVGNLMLVDPGFRSEGVLTLKFSLLGQAYGEDPAVAATIDRIVHDVAALPGVEAAALASQIPFGRDRDGWGFHVEGRIGPNPEQDPSAERYGVTPDYFRVMQIPLKRGRLLTDADRAGSMPVLLVGEALAHSVFAGADPIGQRVRIGPATEGPWFTIVGVVGDVHHKDLTSSPSLQMYVSQAQVPSSFLTLTARASTGDPAALSSQVRAVLRTIDPAIPVFSVAPLSELVASAMADRRFVMQLLSAFAAVSLLLAAVGLYGVVAYMVAQRTRELGVRVALGARPSHVVRLVLSSGAVTVALGLVAGLGAAAVANTLLGTLLFDVRATDPLTLTTAAVTLAVVALAAHVVPAARALRIDPATVLRQD